MHLALVIGAVLMLSNRLPRRYRGQLQAELGEPVGDGHAEPFGRLR